MIYVHLPADQRDELNVVSRQAIGRVARLSHMVLLSDRGFTVPQIAAIHDCGGDVVRIWLHRYEQHGVAGLEDEPRSGRPPKDHLAGPIVDAQASQSPPCSGHVQACWSVALLTAFLAQRFRLLLSCASVRRYLHQMGWRWARPRLAPARKPDPEAEAKRTALTQAQEQARHGLAHLLSPLRVGPASLAAHPFHGDERPASAHPDPWDEPTPRLLRRAGRRERALVLCRS
jgi:transposase